MYGLCIIYLHVYYSSIFQQIPQYLHNLTKQLYIWLCLKRVKTFLKRHYYLQLNITWLVPRDCFNYAGNNTCDKTRTYAGNYTCDKNKTYAVIYTFGKNKIYSNIFKKKGQSAHQQCKAFWKLLCRGKHNFIADFLNRFLIKYSFYMKKKNHETVS